MKLLKFNQIFIPLLAWPVTLRERYCSTMHVNKSFRTRDNHGNNAVEPHLHNQRGRPFSSNLIEKLGIAEHDDCCLDRKLSGLGDSDGNPEAKASFSTSGRL